MKKIIYILFLFLMISCKKEDNLLEKIAIIEKSNIEVFKNVSIKATQIKDNKYKVSFFTVAVDNKNYQLPNFQFFDCKTGDTICLRNFTPRKVDLLEFGYANGYKDKNEGYKFTSDYIENVMREYNKINIYKVSSNPSIGDAVIFYYEENNYIAYIPDISKVKNESWKERINEKNKIKQNWYKGNW